MKYLLAFMIACVMLLFGGNSPPAGKQENNTKENYAADLDNFKTYDAQVSVSLENESIAYALFHFPLLEFPLSKAYNNTFLSPNQIYVNNNTNKAKIFDSKLKIVKDKRPVV